MKQEFAALAFALMALAGCSKQEAQDEKPKAVVAVKVARAEMANLKLTVSAPATVWPREQANIAGRTTAPIRELKVHKGDSVSVNQVLAVLESRDLAAQRAEALAALADAEQNLQKTQSGTLPAEVERARGQVATAEAALTLAQKTYERRSELYKQGAIPGRELLQSETELAQAKTSYAVARKSLELLQSQSSARDIAIARSRVDQARARLSNVTAQLQYTELRAPFAGTITDQLQYPGDMAQPGSPTFTIMDLSVVIARSQVPEAELERIKAGQACEFAPADAADAPTGGTVTMVNKAVDPQRRTVEVWCRIPNSAHRLRANVFGNANFFVGGSTGVTVPQAAVQFSEGTRNGTVMVVDRKKIAHLKEVEASQVGGGQVQLANGVEAGQLVIVEGGYGLPDGAQVQFSGGNQ